jgi:pimeloyl-ACP methyl ester carboxylesterase
MIHFQEPIPPFSYETIDITFDNHKAGITLAGTITKPQNSIKAPCILLLSGMGPTNRNGDMFGHKLYLVLADFLTKQGFVTLRYDKRGVGSSTGAFDSQVTINDLAQDAQAGLEYLKSLTFINQNRISILGHSEGGLISSLLASQDNNIRCFISLAGAVTNDPKILAQQIKTQLNFDGASSACQNAMKELFEQVFTIIKNNPDIQKAESELFNLATQALQKLPNGTEQEAEKYHFAVSLKNLPSKIAFYNGPYYRSILGLDMKSMLQKIECPFLALYGLKGFMTPELMLPYIKNIIKAKYTNSELLAIQGINHAFQPCQTGALSEYAIIKETIDLEVLKIINQWFLKHL